MRLVTIPLLICASASLSIAQDDPGFTPEDPSGIDEPTTSPPSLDTGTLTPPSTDLTPPSIGDKLQAISTRAQISAGEGVMINGFIIEGSGDKTVVIAGKGPSFRSDTIPDTLDDPFLRLFRLESGGWVEIATNDDWETGLSTSDRTLLSDNDFTPTNAQESIIVATLSAGTYGAQLEGKDGDEGVGLAEVYDFDTTSVSKITALSTRVYAGTGGDTLVGGFIIDGTSDRTVGVRITGPSLTAAGISGALADPSLEVLRFNDSTGQFESITGATNDDWETGLSDADRTIIEANSFAPSNALEPALVLTLSPGVYGGVVTGAGNSDGIALIEVYDFSE